MLSVQVVRLPKKGLASLWTAGGRNLAGTWCVPMLSCATLPCFLPGLVASEEEDAERPSAEWQDQWVKPWRSVFPDICSTFIARLGPWS